MAPEHRAPSGLTAAVRREWADFWASDLAAFVDVVDLPALRRLHEHKAERERLAKVGDRTTREQIRLSQLERLILAGEKRFGLDPSSRGTVVRKAKAIEPQRSAEPWAHAGADPAGLADVLSGVVGSFALI
jgi:hypothetical protein